MVSVDPSTITEIRQDRENRGTWVTIQRKTGGNIQKIHLLLELGEGKLLSRIIEDNTEKIFARITYEDWLSIGACKQPQLIKVTGLQYKTELTITLSDVLIADYLSKEDFELTAPAGYIKQFLP